MKLSLFFILLTTLASCTGPKAKKDPVHPGAMGVELSRPATLDPQVNAKVQVGPKLIDEGMEALSSRPRLLPVVGLHLGPGLMRSFAFISSLRELEREGIRVNVISGSELGLVIAALYAFGMSPDLIEWRFFNFVNAAQGVRVHSEEWLNLLERELLGELSKQKVEEAQRTLIAPVYQYETERVEYFRRGSLIDLVRAQFRFQRPVRPPYWSAPHVYEVFSKKAFDDLGVDYSIGLNVLDRDIIFKRPESFLLGIFGRAYGHLQREDESLSAVVTIKSSGYPLDSYELSELTKQVDRVKWQEEIKSIKSDLENWHKNSDRESREQFDQYFNMGENTERQKEVKE